MKFETKTIAGFPLRTAKTLSPTEAVWRAKNFAVQERARDVKKLELVEAIAAKCQIDEHDAVKYLDFPDTATDEIFATISSINELKRLKASREPEQVSSQDSALELMTYVLNSRIDWESMAEDEWADLQIKMPSLIKGSWSGVNTATLMEMPEGNVIYDWLLGELGQGTEESEDPVGENSEDSEPVEKSLPTSEATG